MNKIREPDVIFKWTNCCRLCLSQESTIDLFSEASISQHFPSKIRTCLNFLIYSGDPMPRKICAACCKKLNNWFEFQKECIQTEKELKKRLEPYKKMSFVKEYFDKYLKYEKSSQDGSISMDSMSEYDEDEEFDEFGGDNDDENDFYENEDENDDDEEEEEEEEEEDDDEDVVMHENVLQKVDESNTVNNNRKKKSSLDISCFETKQNIVKNSFKISDNHHVRDALGNAIKTDKDNKTNNETQRNVQSTQKMNLKNSGQYKDAISKEVKMKIYSTKEIKCSTSKGSLVAGNADIKNSDETGGLLKGSRERKCVKELEDKTPVKCPDCGIAFPDGEHLAVHTCKVMESGGDSDDNDNFINPLSFVDISLSEPAKESFRGGNASHNGSSGDERESIVTQWKCIVCSRYYNSMVALKQHYNNGNCGKTDIKLECEFCKSIFSSIDDFVEHQLVHIENQMGEKNSDSISSNFSDQFGKVLIKENEYCQEEKGKEEEEGKEDKEDREEEEEEEEEEEREEEEKNKNTESKGDGGFVCNKCEQSFPDKELYEKHELIHNQQDLFNSIPTPAFTAFEGIEMADDAPDENEAMDGEKKPQNVIRCFRCGRFFNSSEELERHEFLKHKNPTPFFCRKCNLRFSARSQLLMHVRSHVRKNAPCPTDGPSGDNTCTVCNAKFFLTSDLQYHLKMHTYSPVEEPLPPPFPASQKPWPNQDPLEDNKIDLFAKFKCSVCSKIFVHSGSIIRHGKNLHKGQAVYPLRLKKPIFLMKRARTLSLPSDKSLKVLHASKPLSNNTEAINATLQESQIQEESCDPDIEMSIGKDPKWEHDPEGLKSDQNHEFGTEKCPFCEKLFKPTYLPRHIKRNHRGEVLDPQMLGRDIPDDSLVCRYCLKSCSNPHNRRVHESIHYPVKMQHTQCKICGQKFFNKSSFDAHSVTCKSVRCAKCNKIFFRHLSLKNHSCIVTLPSENKA